MRREYIVARIEASQDGTPYVYVTFNDPKEYKPDKPNVNPFGQGTATFSSMDDLMKNMPKIMANVPGIGGGLTEAPKVKLRIREELEKGIKVWHKVHIEIQKKEDSCAELLYAKDDALS